MKSMVWIGLAVAALGALAVYGAYAADAPAADVKVILDFEDAGDAKMVKGADDPVTVAVDESHATSGKKSLKVTVAKGSEYGPFDIIGDALKGWDKYKFVAIDFTTDAPVAGVKAVPEVWDDKSTNFQTRSTLEDDGAELKKGKVTMVIDLSKFQRNDKSGKMDLTKMTKFRFILTGLKDTKEDFVTYVDNVRLSNEEPKK